MTTRARTRRLYGVHALADTVTMLRRSLRHAWRSPSMTLTVVGMPVVTLLLFTYVLGGALGDGIGGPYARGGAYVDYVAPGIILTAATAGALVTAVAVCVDVTDGLGDRFRTMAISRASFLTGHVVGSLVQTLLSVLLVLAVAVLAGFRPDATPVEWLAAFGVLTLLTLALTWPAALVGLVARTPETASNVPMPVQFLPFLGSAVVPPETMPAGLRWFAEYQPFTPATDTLRGLLTGTAVGGSALAAVAWCGGLAAVGYVWARSAFDRGAGRRGVPEARGGPGVPGGPGGPGGPGYEG
ncbi:ABC transporter permease [Streptomyces armeniacus]|uniref:Transport permease protein n=1 Tax=Streptomyces armeniacus TaxID=83291 RepID=A0A345XTV5_9ACTN|nr:ABC transporter permease [Streptomyces armeniacus]AXK35071.1 ABC transporter permease [Streptomyces armeniacus]